MAPEDSAPDRGKTPDERPPGFVSDVLDELIVGLVALLFLPWILRERWRRRREARSGKAAGTDRAVQDVLQTLETSIQPCGEASECTPPASAPADEPRGAAPSGRNGI